MDFKYIEQLLQRYFAAETTVEEEHILHTFFRQDQMPEHLRKWQPLFRTEDDLSHLHLGDDFDQRMLDLVGERHVKAQRIPLYQRLRPLYTAAAFIAFAVIIGATVEQTAVQPDETATEINVATVQDELDPTETKTLNIQSAEVTGIQSQPAVSDSLQNIN
ncbi:MAG: hypothetical protein K6A32_07680 [Bacteroidales bacterium]|nr:hypothetical protein [Bacteroidales bacterium]